MILLPSISLYVILCKCIEICIRYWLYTDIRSYYWPYRKWNSINQISSSPSSSSLISLSLSLSHLDVSLSVNSLLFFTHVLFKLPWKPHDSSRAPARSSPFQKTTETVAYHAASRAVLPPVLFGVRAKTRASFKCSLAHPVFLHSLSLSTFDLPDAQLGDVIDSLRRSLSFKPKQKRAPNSPFSSGLYKRKVASP